MIFRTDLTQNAQMLELAGRALTRMREHEAARVRMTPAELAQDDARLIQALTNDIASFGAWYDNRTGTGTPP